MNKFHIALTSLLLALYVFNAVAQGVESNPYRSVSAEREGLTVSLSISPYTRIPMGLTGQIEIKNAEKSRDVKISIVKLRPIGTIGRVYGEIKNVVRTEFNLPAGALHEIPVTLPSSSTPTLLEHMGFRTGPNDFIIVIEYFDEGKAYSIQFMVSPRVQTSRLYVVIGGLVGAMLLIAFMASSRILRLADKHKLNYVVNNFGKLTVKWAIMAIAYAVNGAIVALLLILFSNGLESFALPIGLKLEDFSGGLLVGLFSVALGKYISDKVSLSI